MCIVIICFPVYDIMTFEIKLSSLVKPFSYMTTKVNKKISRMKRAFNLINFKGLSLKQIKPTFLKGESLTLDEFERLYNQIKHGTELPTYFLAYRVIKDVNIANKSYN